MTTARSPAARSATARDRRRSAAIFPASVRVGADAVSIDDCGKPHGTFSFNEDNLCELATKLMD